MLTNYGVLCKNAAKFFSLTPVRSFQVSSERGLVRHNCLKRVRQSKKKLGPLDF